MLMVKTRIVESEPALILQEKEEKYLVVADLHLGFEHILSANKIFLGSNFSVKQITANLKNIIRNENIDSVILLGDIKSGIQYITKNEWDEVPYFFDEIKRSLT